MLLLAGFASAAEITLSVSTASAPDAVAFDFNPRSGNALQPVASAGYSFTASRSASCFGGTIETSSSASAAAAGYGSDVSLDGRYNAALLGTAVEPMADAQASATVSRSAACTVNPPTLPYQPEIATATVGGNVNHRIVARPGAGAPGLELLLDIPVRLDYALAASTSTQATAFASFWVTADEEQLFSQIAQCQTAGCSEEVEGTWSTVARRSTDGQDVLYNIRVSANASAMPGLVLYGTATADAQAVADPFLYVDPDWEYAQYFMVQQESVANPGGWAEVTREWRSTVVPVPGALWLGLSACGALLPWARRRDRGTPRPSPDR